MTNSNLDKIPFKTSLDTLVVVCPIFHLVPTMEAQPSNTVTLHIGDKATENIQPQTPRRLNMREQMLPSSRGGDPDAPSQLHSFTFSMPTNQDDHSIASTITMNTFKTEPSSSVDVYNFRPHPTKDVEAAVEKDDVDVQAEQFSHRTSASAGCFRFERIMDSVFVKIYELFLDEEAMMFACQDEPTEGTPILDYPVVVDEGSDIPVVISTEETVEFPDRGASASQLSKTLAAYRSSSLSVDDCSASLAKQDPIDSKRETEQHNATSADDAKEIRKNDDDDARSDSSPWRLDTILYPSRRHRKNENIELCEAGGVVQDAEVTINFGESVPKRKSIEKVSKSVSVHKPLVESAKEPVKKQVALLSSPPAAATSDAETAPSTNIIEPPIAESQPTFQPMFHTADCYSITKSTYSNSKKRSLGLRYLFSPRLRKLSFLPWNRTSLQKYQNMKKFDDPSFAPETVTTTAHSTHHSDGFSFQCDMSLKTSSVMSLKTTSVLLKQTQDLSSGAGGRNETGSLYYSYPQSMVA